MDKKWRERKAIRNSMKKKEKYIQEMTCNYSTGYYVFVINYILLS
jgi:hypothetical protein